jgi:hypothetical protein
MALCIQPAVFEYGPAHVDSSLVVRLRGETPLGPELALKKHESEIERHLCHRLPNS